MLELKDLRKKFKLSHAGSASLKTALLWWKRKRTEDLEVLNGLTFTISKGESAAIVGRNGAGKSTLLSLIARVYKPDSGSISVHGRIAPLLELGAGFHPDLTGAENVVFNGMILGLKRAEIRARVGDILGFAELERHADAPVRTYSSGMLARLGFSVAAHVDADILIVDEVLAVGDYSFEQKCYQTIEEFQAKGGTILFVSHNMDHIRRISNRVLWLEKGSVRMDGPPERVIPHYLGQPVE
jgi:ABC-type polysaccharide/polyol phosphate transport system ATPase subunit